MSNLVIGQYVFKYSVWDHLGLLDTFKRNISLRPSGKIDHMYVFNDAHCFEPLKNI